MSKKTIYQTIKDIKIYPIDYLVSKELSDNDLNNLLDNNKRGLIYSLIIGMFKFTKSKLSNEKIIDLIRSDNNWYKKIIWTKYQREKYEKYVIDVFKNVYQYKGTTAVSLGEWFMTIYGLNVKENKIDL